MDKQSINQLVNIKTIGWTSLVIAGTLFIWLLFQTGATFLFDNAITSMNGGLEGENEIIDEMQNTTNKVKAILLLSLLFTGIVSFASFGLAKLKKWGLILFQAITIFLIIAVLSGLAFCFYYLTTKVQTFENPLKTSMKYYTMGYGIFMALFAWALTRVNIYLKRVSKKVEFI
ncbi:hypothetical protein SAMN05661096_04137 [Marivirga sericea]|uniref:Uncharacterized protein n=1 Tax=Marivirga sericea TaxID=1028 RepID=A0A1X7LKH0_9BACT|nr:hypothetical protein [Marivirga sericea]SMG54376.1 hypothetical protein SAMN05661096_04137 [Marivirga sericea]